MSATGIPAGEATASPRTPGELFVAFTVLALQGFGGVLPIAQRELVDKRRWLTQAQFLETLSIGQVLPGPNIVNMALIIGDRFLGWRGALASLAGLLLAPLSIVMTMAALYARFASNPVVAGAVRGMGAVAAGLIIAMALKLLPTLRRNPLPRAVCALGVVATWAAVGAFRVPMAWVVLGVGALTMALAWRRVARASP